MRPHPIVSGIARATLGGAERRRYADVGLGLGASELDLFGASADWVAMGAGLLRLPYERWFRVTSHHAARIPREGPAILAANHSGVIPIDAALVWLDVLRHTTPARVLRPILDHFVPAMPFIGTLFARTGSVGGSRENVERLLADGQLVLIFPEGVAGVGKTFTQRYQLQGWRVGHAEIAIRARVPVVPVAIVGAEEQFLQIGKIRAGVTRLGIPHLPIVVTPLPLPVHYHVLYGEPLVLYGSASAGEADDPRAAREAADRVRRAVEDLIAEGLRTRRGIFR